MADARKPNRTKFSSTAKIYAGGILFIVLLVCAERYGESRGAGRARRANEPFVVSGTNWRKDVQYGSAVLEGAKRGNWFAGHFLDPENILRNDDVELKWSENQRGSTNGDVAANKKGHSICILFSGKHLVDFGNEKVLLERRGDYVVWGPGVPHTWTALTDVVVLTLRWPSLAGDQKLVENASSVGFRAS